MMEIVAFLIVVAVLTVALPFVGMLLRKRRVVDKRRLYVKNCSVVIPVLNEEKNIGQCIEWIKSLEPGPYEIIVVDGGSEDATEEVARKHGVSRVLKGERGRAKQMNLGSRACGAGCEAIMFVHSDSRPAKDSIRYVEEVLSCPSNVLGGFLTKIRHRGRVLRVPTWHQQIAFWLYPALFKPFAFAKGLGCMFGDQNLFCRRKDFERVGGYNTSLCIMEDVDLCLRMHRHGLGARRPGRIVRVTKSMNITSGRRIAAWGPIRATYIHFRIGLSWFLGAKQEALYRLYHRLYTDRYRE